MTDFVLSDGNDTFPGAGDDTTGNDRIEALLGNDSVQGGSLNDTIFGGGGVDTIHGDTFGFDPDVIFGNDLIYGGGANDIVQGGGGSDTLYGESGNDTLDGGGANESDVLYGGIGGDRLRGGSIISVAAQAADSLYGGADDDNLEIQTPTGGTMTVLTYSGSVFSGGAGFDYLFLGTTSKTLDLTGATISGIEYLQFDSTTGFGVILTAAQANAIGSFQLGSGFLELADDSAVVLDGVITAAEVRMADGGQSLNMGEASWGFPTNSGAVIGGRGGDSITGTQQRDQISGGSGNDVIAGGGSTSGFDILRGEGGNDTLRGGEELDALYGGKEQDLLRGGGGADSISGDQGRDRITGGTGRDTLTGGAGSDQFIFTDTGDSSADPALADIIADFTIYPARTAAFIDRINLAAIDADAAGGAADDVFTFRGTAAFSAAGQVRVVQDGADTIVEVNTTGTDGAEMVIRLIGVNAAQIEAADFVL